MRDRNENADDSSSGGAYLAAACACGSIGLQVNEIRLCQEHHRYWRGEQELASVTHIIKMMWPVPKRFVRAPLDVLAHAHERGVRIDHYFSDYLRTGRVLIPSGEWLEVSNLVHKLIMWWDAQGLTCVYPQVIVADHEVAGTCDLVCKEEDNTAIYDLKTTHDLEPTYAIQLGAYAELYSATFQQVMRIGIIHLHNRFDQPRLIWLDLDECQRDWRNMRDYWSMVQRRIAHNQRKTTMGDLN